MRHTPVPMPWLLVALACFAITHPPQALANGFKVIGALTREAQLQPGQKAVGRIMVQNTSGAIVEVEATLRDYAFDSEGGNRYDPLGTQARSNGTWVEISPKQLRIPPGETLAFHYTMAAPQDSDLHGSYWSMLLISGIPTDTASLDPKKQRQVAVTTTLRYGVQMITEVGKEGVGSIKVTKASLQEAPSLAEGDPPRRVLGLSLENDGTRHVRPDLWLEVYNEAGVPMGKFPGQSKRIYPGCSARIEVDLSALPQGKYQSLMLADLGRDEVIGARYELNIP